MEAKPIIHLVDMPCITGKQKKPLKYTTTFHPKNVTCEKCKNVILKTRK